MVSGGGRGEEAKRATCMLLLPSIFRMFLEWLSAFSTELGVVGKGRWQKWQGLRPQVLLACHNLPPNPCYSPPCILSQVQPTPNASNQSQPKKNRDCPTHKIHQGQPKKTWIAQHREASCRIITAADLQERALLLGRESCQT